MTRWIPANKGIFLLVAAGLMTLSLLVAIKEKKEHGKNTGLIVFAAAMLMAISLLAFSKISYGYFIQASP